MENEQYLYSLKKSLITQTEKPYLTAIKHSLPQGYFVQPQINLASIIEKHGDSKFHNELFRNVDAVVFDMSYKPIVVIEINDSSHIDSHRKTRDKKVRDICEEAGIKVVTFWTSYGVNNDYIFKTVNEAIAKAPEFVRVKHSVDKPEVTNTDNSGKTNADNGIKTNSQQKSKQENGCYIATSVYGSYDCENVWVLRRYRDFYLAQSFFGRCFIKAYYFISPTVVKLFGDSMWFKKFWRKRLDKMVIDLKNNGYSDMPYNDLY